MRPAVKYDGKLCMKIFWIMGILYTCHNIMDHVKVFFNFPSIITRRTFSNGNLKENICNF